MILTKFKQYLSAFSVDIISERIMECAKENTTSELRKKNLKRIRVVKDDN